MNITIFSDIQGNYKALIQFFKETKRQTNSYFCLGDIVQDGTSFDENRVIELLRQHNVVTVQGNHDASVAEKRDKAIRKIHPHNIDYLAGLPVTTNADGFHLVHAPGGIRIFNDEDAKQGFSFLPLKTRICFYGHSHRPAVYYMGASGRVYELRKKGQMILDEKSRYLINPGGIGLLWGAPSTYMVYDSESRTLELKKLNEGKEERR